MLEEVADWYTLFVLAHHIPEETFWFADLSFLFEVAANWTAFQEHQAYLMERERERSR